MSKHHQNKQHAAWYHHCQHLQKRQSIFGLANAFWKGCYWNASNPDKVKQRGLALVSQRDNRCLHTPHSPALPVKTQRTDAWAAGSMETGCAKWETEPAIKRHELFKQASLLISPGRGGVGFHVCWTPVTVTVGLAITGKGWKQSSSHVLKYVDKN